MQDPFDAMNLMLIVYAIPFTLLLLAGIVVIVIGYGKEKKPLKIAGLIITVIGFQSLVFLGCLSLYFKFVESFATI